VVLPFPRKKKIITNTWQVGKRYLAWFVLFFFFGDYFFLILYVYAIRKNTSKQKEKHFFIEDFYLSRGEDKKRGKSKSGQ